MELNKRDSERQKATLALYFFKENNNQELFGKWDIYIGKKYILGRKNCDINIDHPLISRRHLELIFYSNDLINIRDLGSRNGTYINNAKINPYQEIKFSSKDKFSLGDINNKVLFLENQETKKSIFEPKINTTENNDQKASEDTKKIVNYDKRRNPYNNQYNQYNNRFRNRQFGTRNNRFRSDYRFRPRSYHKNNYIKPKTRDVHSENYNNSLSSETYKSENKDKKFKKSPIPLNRYQKKNFEQYENFKKENEIIGRKVERNKIESKNDKKLNEKKNLEKLIKSKKIGLEKLKKKLKSIENSDEEEEIEEDEDELDLFDEEDKKGNKNQRIIFRTNKLNDLEFVMPVNDKNVKNLKNVKKVKYLVNGYMVLNVKKKKLIYE